MLTINFLQMDNKQQPQSPENADSTNSNDSTNPTNPNDLVQTGNSLADVVAWLKLGHTVIIHAKGYGKMYRMPGLKAIQKIYVNVSKFPSLLDEGEWPWYIEDAGAEEILNDAILYEKQEIVSFKI